jgi:hypothetical protein
MEPQGKYKVFLNGPRHDVRGVPSDSGGGGIQVAIQVTELPVGKPLPTRSMIHQLANAG